MQAMAVSMVSILENIMNIGSIIMSLHHIIREQWLKLRQFAMP